MGLFSKEPSTPKPAPPPTPSGLDVAAEAAHLRRLIEKQPACLIRVGRDGVLLAVNEAALGLFGADSLGKVLGHRLTERIPEEAQPLWTDFVTRVEASGSGSLECVLLGPGTERRTVLMQAALLRDHPDRIESMLVAIRDLSASRRVEQALRDEAARRRQLEDTRAKLELVAAEHQRLKGLLEASENDRHQLTRAIGERDAERLRLDAERKADAAKLQDQAEQLQLAVIEKEREYRDQVAALRAQLTEAVTEGKRLSGAIEAQAAERLRLEAGWADARAALEQALRDERRDLEQAKEHASRQLGDLHARLASVGAGHSQFAARLAEAERQREQLEAERAAAQSALEQAVERSRTLERALEHERTQRDHVLDHGDSEFTALDSRLTEATAEQARLTALVEQGAGEIARLTALVDQATAEKTRLAALVEQASAERQRLESEHEAARAAFEQERDRLEAAHKMTRATLEAERERLEADHARARAALEAALDQERQHVARSRQDVDVRTAELETRLSAAVAEHTRLAALADRGTAEQARLAALVDASESERRRIEAEQAAVRAELEQALRTHRERVDTDHQHAARFAELESRLATALGEQTRLAAAVDRSDAERLRIESDHTRVRTELEEALRVEREQKSASLQHGDRDFAQLRARVSAALAEQMRLATLLEDTERDRQRLEMERVDARMELQRALDDERARAARRDDEQHQALTDIGAQLTRALAESQRLAAQLEREDATRQQMAAEHAQTRAQLERERLDRESDARQRDERHQRELADLRARYEQIAAEHERLTAVVGRHDGERLRTAAEHTAEIADIERRLLQEHDRAVTLRQREQRDLIANLQAELALSMADQKRLQMLLTRAEVDQKRMVAEYTADRAQAERALGEAIFKKNQILKVLADQRVDLQRLTDNSRALEPFAAAGRLAVEVGRELQELAAEIDSRSRFILSLSALESSYRSELESLRADAVRAASLARQFAFTNLRQPAIPFDDDDSAAQPGPKDIAETL